MKQRRFKTGILFPDGDVKWLLYGAPTKDGFVYGISHADTHITALPDTKSVSFHLKNQKLKKWKHLGRIIKDGNYEDLQQKVLNPRVIVNEGLDEQVVYITKRGMELLNQPSDIIIETETDQERIFLLDLLSFFNKSKKMFSEFSQNFLNLFGLCTAREILSNNEYEAGITSRETVIVEVDGDLYEIDIKSFLDLTNEENPLQDLLSSLGIPSLIPEFDRRLLEVLEEKKDSLEEYSFFESESPS